jgi:hypothetical protein
MGTGWHPGPSHIYIIPCFDKPYAFLAPCFMLVSCMAYTSTLKMEVTFFSKTWADFQWTTQHYIPEERTVLCKDCQWSNLIEMDLNYWKNFYQAPQCVHRISFTSPNVTENLPQLQKENGIMQDIIISSQSLVFVQFMHSNLLSSTISIIESEILTYIPYLRESNAHLNSQNLETKKRIC